MKADKSTWDIATRIWWALTWRGVIAAFALSFLVVFATSMAAGILGLGRHPTLNIFLSIVCSVVASVWAMRAALSSRYRGFSIRIATDHTG